MGDVSGAGAGNTLTGAANPPILHRKEEFVPVGYPGREKFARLTKQEERHGLYEDTSRIGRRDGWNFALDEKQVQLRGHQLVRRSATPE
jgi:hypothetical protein